MNDLSTRLAGVDPASDLPPLPDGRRQALLERAAGAPARRTRRGLALVALGRVAAAGAVATASLVLIPQPGVLDLEAASDAGASCMALSEAFVPILRDESDVAFEGRVVDGATTSDDATVVIKPTRFFRGGPAGEVRLRTPPMEGYVEFDEGATVLVSASEGRVLGCGASGEESSELLRYYEQAFMP